MVEEADALFHSSKAINKFLKTGLTLFILVTIECIQFTCQVAVIGALISVELFFGILFDILSTVVAMILFGLFTNLPDQVVQILGAMPFLLIIFFSTTFSPRDGVNGLKGLICLFSLFCLWCMLPEDVGMEGCLESNTMLYLILSSLVAPFLFALCKVGINLYKTFHREKKQSSRLESMKTVQFAELQFEFFGEKALENLKHIVSTVGTYES